MNRFIAGNAGIAKIFDSKFFFKLSVKDTFTNFPNPSVVFKKIFPPRRLLMLYDEYEPQSMEYKVGQRNDRYIIELTQSIKK